jgi:hypothetical protein
MIHLRFSVDGLFHLPRKYFARLGFSFEPSDSHNRRDRLKQLVKNYFFGFCVLNLVVIIFLEGMHAAHESKSEKSNKGLFALRVVFITIKIVCLCSQRRKVSEFFRELRLIFNGSTIEREKCADLLQYLGYFKSMCLFIAYCSMAVVIMKVLLNDPGHVRDFFWVPSTNRCFLFAFTLWLIFVIISENYIIIVTEATMVTLIKYAALSFDLIGRKVEALSATDVIGDVVKLHLRVIELKNMLERILLIIFFTLFVQCSTNICSIGLRVAQSTRVDEKVVLLCYLLQSLSQLLSVCYFGKQVKNASLRIGDAVLASWNQIQNLKVKKSLIIMTLFSQREQMIKARGFGNISMATFTSVSMTKLIKLHLIQFSYLRLF